MTQPAVEPSRTPMERFWEQVTTGKLAQGDLLPACSVAVVNADFDEAAANLAPVRVRVDVLDVIVMTQSCDLENNKAPLVACCPIHAIKRFEEYSPRFKKAGA